MSRRTPSHADFVNKVLPLRPPIPEKLRKFDVKGTVYSMSSPKLTVPSSPKSLFDNVSEFAYTVVMSPTIFRVGNYRFYFFSREEERIHVHVISPDGEAKFWIEPIVALVSYTGLSKRQLARLQKIVEERRSEIIKAWRRHFET